MKKIILFFKQLCGLPTPINFKIKIDRWSTENYYVKYTINGWRWKYIYEARSPLFNHSMDYDWEWRRLSYNVFSMSVEDTKKQFSTYTDVLDFIAKEKEIYKKGAENRKLQRKDYYESINNRLK